MPDLVIIDIYLLILKNPFAFLRKNCMTILPTTYTVAKQFADTSPSLDFDDTGKLLLATDPKTSTLRVYDILNGTLTNTIPSKKYGCALGRFTHKSTNIIYCSTIGENAIRYMSLHDNKFINYFKGTFQRS